MRAIDGDELSRRMYTEAFLKDTDMQKWDSGCWIRYKLFENVLEEQPTIEPELKWIPCSERLPVENTEVLTYDSSFGITFDSLHCGKWRKQPAAWMPLPEPYREGEQNG